MALVPLHHGLKIFPMPGERVALRHLKTTVPHRAVVVVVPSAMMKSPLIPFRRKKMVTFIQIVTQAIVLILQYIAIEKEEVMVQDNTRNVQLAMIQVFHSIQCVTEKDLPYHGSQINHR